MEQKIQHHLLLTVDTEFSTHKGTLGVWGEIQRRQYGIPQIIGICNQHQIKATFFLDVYQKESEIRRAGEFILQHGHEIQLHTHPNWRYDRRRENMNYYNPEEQCEIIRYGKEQMYAWFGINPVAHRAGDFALNAQTLSALEQNEIMSDFSFFYQWPECRLESEIKLKNKITWIGKVLEVPVTCFYSPGLGISKSIRLIDINEPLPLLLQLFRKLKKDHFRTIVVVLHSFSFIGCNESPVYDLPRRQIYWPLLNNVTKFQEVLAFLKSDMTFDMKTVSDYVSVAQAEPESVSNPDEVPEISFNHTLRRFWDRGRTVLWDRFFRIRHFMPSSLD